VISRLVDQCAANGKLSRSQCRCIFTKFAKEYTPAQLGRILGRKGNLPPKAVQIIQNCAASS
jgi:hypothetical protein